MMEWQAYANRFYSTQQLINQFDHRTYFFLLGGSFGDLLPNLSLIREFILKNDAVVHVIIDSKWKKLCERFFFKNLNFIYINSEAQFRTALMQQNRIFSLLPGIIYPLLPTLHPNLGELAALGFISDTQIKKYLLKLDQNTNFTLPFINNNDDTKLRYSFSETLLSINCRPGKTIVLSFENNSNPPLDVLYLELLLNCIKDNNDFDILFNTSSTFNTDSIYSEYYQKFPTIQIPQDYPLEFIETAGYHIGTTHGLSMIISIYPNNIKHCLLIDASSDFIINNGQKVKSRDWLSLEKYLNQDYLKSNNLTEIFIDINNIKNFVESIDSWLIR
jgi:hypothetical protein